MSWKRAQTHAESMLQNLGLGPTRKGRKDLQGKRLVLVDDGLNPYRAMCFTVAAKIFRRRGGDVEATKPETGEAPHAKIVDAPGQKSAPPNQGPRPGQPARPPAGSPKPRPRMTNDKFSRGPRS